MELLNQLYVKVVHDLLTVDFTDSSRDAETIRYHAALTGKKQILDKILNYDKVLIAEMQETINENLE